MRKGLALAGWQLLILLWSCGSREFDVFLPIGESTETVIVALRRGEAPPEVSIQRVQGAALELKVEGPDALDFFVLLYDEAPETLGLTVGPQRQAEQGQPFLLLPDGPTQALRMFHQDRYQFRLVSELPGWLSGFHFLPGLQCPQFVTERVDFEESTSVVGMLSLSEDEALIVTSTSAGLFRLRGSSLESVPIELGAMQPTAVTQANDGTLYLAFRDGERDVFWKGTLEDGFEVLPSRPNDDVQDSIRWLSVRPSTPPVLYALTVRSRLFRFDGQWRQLQDGMSPRDKREGGLVTVDERTMLVQYTDHLDRTRVFRLDDDRRVDETVPSLLELQTIRWIDGVGAAAGDKRSNLFIRDPRGDWTYLGAPGDVVRVRDMVRYDNGIAIGKTDGFLGFYDLMNEGFCPTREVADMHLELLVPFGDGLLAAGARVKAMNGAPSALFILTVPE